MRTVTRMWVTVVAGLVWVIAGLAVASRPEAQTAITPKTNDAIAFCSVWSGR